VVGVFVNHHVVAVPIPGIAVGKVKRCHAEVEAAKPETTGIAALYAPPVSTAEATIKAAVLPGMVEMETSVIASRVVTDPFAVVVDVRGLRMAVAVPKRVLVAIVMVVIVAIVFMPVAVISLRTMVRNVSSTDVVVAVVAIVVLVFLGECRHRQEQGDRKHSGKQFH
jgi:hypothetical protein